MARYRLFTQDAEINVGRAVLRAGDDGVFDVPDGSTAEATLLAAGAVPALGQTAAQAAAMQAAVSGAGMSLPGTELLGPTAGVTPTFSGTAAGISGTAVSINGEQWWRIDVTGAGYVEVNVPTFTALCADTLTVEYIADPTVTTQLVPYIGTAAYAVFANAIRNIPAASSQADWRVPGGHAVTYFQVNDWAKNAYTRDTIEQQWVTAKLRVQFSAAGTFYLRSLRAGGGQRKGRICVIADDGWRSWFLRGAPLLARYGIPSTNAIIPSLIGSSPNHATEAMLQDYVAQGNANVTHGPIGGSGNLFTRWGTDAEALADMIAARDWLLARGLTDSRGAQCYIWPQGFYARTAGDTSFIKAAWDAGFRLGRSVMESTVYPNVRATSSRCLSLLAMPTIGHTYAGATNTADDAAETTNINTIVTRIQALGAQRADGFVMLHQVVGRGAAAAGDTMIEVDRLATICAAIQTEVNAGRLVAVTMPEMLSQTLPRQIVPA